MKQFCCPLKTSLCSLLLWWSFFELGRNSQKVWIVMWKVAPYSTQIVQIVHIQLLRIQLLRNTAIQTVTLVPSSWTLQPTCLCACLVPWYTLLAEWIYCKRPSHLHTEHSTPYWGNNNLYNIWIIWFAMRSGGAVFFSVYLIICLTHEHLNDANK